MLSLTNYFNMYSMSQVHSFLTNFLTYLKLQSILIISMQVLISRIQLLANLQARKTPLINLINNDIIKCRSFYCPNYYHMKVLFIRNVVIQIRISMSFDIFKKTKIHRKSLFKLVLFL